MQRLESQHARRIGGENGAVGFKDLSGFGPSSHTSIVGAKHG